MSATERAAIVRGAYNAAGSFGVTILSAYLTINDWSESAIIAGIAAFGVLGFRAGIEGAYDSHRDRKGDVKPADVGQQEIR